MEEDINNATYRSADDATDYATRIATNNATYDTTDPAIRIATNYATYDVTYFTISVTYDVINSVIDDLLKGVL